MWCGVPLGLRAQHPMLRAPAAAATATADAARRFHTAHPILLVLSHGVVALASFVGAQHRMVRVVITTGR